MVAQDSSLFSANINYKKQDLLFLVTGVIDGDTILVNYYGEEKQVRLLGVDTPEVRTAHSENECYSYESTLFTLYSLRNRVVYLKSDPKNRDSDDYGRLLRFVEIPLANGKKYSLNESLIRRGVAKTTPQYPITELQKYLELEKYAIHSRNGIWGHCY